MSKEEAEEDERKRRGDDMKLHIAIEESKKEQEVSSLLSIYPNPRLWFIYFLYSMIFSEITGSTEFCKSIYRGMIKLDFVVIFSCLFFLFIL